MNTTLREYVPQRVQRMLGIEPVEEHAILKGALAGAAGGIVGTLAMSLFEQVWMRTMASNGSRSRAQEPTDEERNRMENAGIGEGELPQSEPRSHHQRLSPSERMVATLYREVIHKPASPRARKVGGSALHFGFGAAAGAAYGAVAEVEPSVTMCGGTAFGTAVFLAADEVALPMTGLADSPLRTPPRRHLYSLLAHFAYGAATELTRKLLRG